MQGHDDCTMIPRAHQKFWDLHASPMGFTPAQWDTYYPVLTPWLRHDDAEIRSHAMERLCTAVLWAKPSAVPYKDRDEAHSLARLAWLLGAIEAAHGASPDIIPLFLANLRYGGDREPFRAPLQAWLNDLLARPRIGVDRDILEGTLVLLEPIDDNWSRQAGRWISLLDHRSDYIRGCASRRLGGICDDDGVDPTEEELLAMITAKELERPGIAGPFWSENSLAPNWEKYTLWMLDLLERRQGEAPANMPFTDIDFYLHELCCHSPELVRRMMVGGFLELAAMTATEEIHPVPGMEPVLRELACCSHARVAASAARHLERVYRQGPAKTGDAHDDTQT
jgi:hypothetical protein